MGTFRVKVCGITSPNNGRAVCDAGADAVGLNFFEGSSRFVDFAVAGRIAGALPKGVVRTGLFVNAPINRICEAWDRIDLDLIQLHGDEPPEFLVELKGRPVMRAFRLGEDGITPILKYLEECRRLGCLPKLTLIDSYRKGHFGGSGAVADWNTARQYPSENWHPPLVLAGGLTPENVGEAIRIVAPIAVDAASGVERMPGQKDAELVRQFVEAATAALDGSP